MPKAKKKAVAVKKVTIVTVKKPGVAKRVLKKVSYGAGVLVRKVSKVGKIVSPKVWKDAQKSILGKITLKRTPQAKPEVATVPAAVVKSKKKKKAVRKPVRKIVTSVEPVTSVQTETTQPELV
ncbi:MAG: hypothetical protein HQL22_07255 [Candidatus Omnitrophica bacterium]|nr:hypothetical protein [Candidatus Omnitrophota bacterium]